MQPSSCSTPCRATVSVAVLLYVLKKVWVDIDPSIKERAREKLSKWFDEDEISEIDNLFD